MSENLTKPFEISLWADEQDGHGNFIERKIAIIGAQDMDNEISVKNPTFNPKLNDVSELSFDLFKKYYDYKTESYKDNPFISYINNETKIKLYYNDNWYDFYIKTIDEKSSEVTNSYVAKDAFITELSRNGYDIELSSDINNNTGTAEQLGSLALQGTDWIIENGDVIRQKYEEPLYITTIATGKSVVLKALIDYSVNGTVIVHKDDEVTLTSTDSNSKQIYLFYSQIQDKETTFLQAIYADSYSTNDDNVISNSPKWVISQEVIWNGNLPNFASVIELSPLNYRGERLVKKQKGFYSSILSQYVSEYIDSNSKLVYGITNTDYLTSQFIVNLLGNSSNFEVSKDGIESWETRQKAINYSTTFPSIGYALAHSSTTVTPYIAYGLTSAVESVELINNNSINTGLKNNWSYLPNGISLGQKFRLRTKYGYLQKSEVEINPTIGSLQPKDTVDSIHIISDATKGIRGFVAPYSYNSNNEIVPDKTKILLDFNSESSTYSGRNLLLQSGVEVSNANYRVAKYVPSSPLIAGKEYTVTLDVTPSPTADAMCVNASNGWKTIARLELTGADRQTITTTFIMSYYPNKTPDDNADYRIIPIYRAPQTDTGTTIIHSIKIESGDRATDWTPAPEDAQGAESELPFEWLGGEALYGLTYEELKNGNFGFFAYLTETSNQDYYYFIEDIQLFPEYYNSNGDIILPNNYLEAETLTETKYFYPSDLETATSTDELTFYSEDSNTFTPLYYPDYQMIRDISASESNSYDILQSICETFECWMDVKVTRETDLQNRGAIARGLESEYVISRDTIYNGSKVYYKKENDIYTEIPASTAKYQVPCDEGYYELYSYRMQKSIAFREYVGKDNYAGFKYGINLTDSTRNIDSTEIATKVIVKNNEVEGATNGVCSIQRAVENPSKSTFVLNFDYYIKQGLINANELNSDLYGSSGLYTTLSANYNSLATLNSKLESLQQALTEYEAQLQVYSTYVTSSSNTIKDLFEKMAKLIGKTAAEFKITDIQNFKDDKTVMSYYTAYIEENSNKVYYNNKSLELYNSVTDPSNPTGVIVDTKNLISTINSQITDITNINNKTQLKFKNKYIRFLQEGTWDSQDYIDDNLYYLDAVKTTKTSSQPKVSYTFDVLEISEQEGYNGYEFSIGDRTYVEDPEMFGYIGEGIFKSPYREEVVISEVSINLMDNSQNEVVVQNYKTQFEDLFSRVSAAVQDVESNSTGYQRAASIVEATGAISVDSLQQTFNNNSDLVISFGRHNTITQGEDGITVFDSYNKKNIIKIMSGGIFLSSDNGVTWKTGITGKGINTNLLTAGSINAEQINIISGSSPSFRWDSSGISAYSYNTVVNGVTTDFNFSKFVRLDKFGVYGYEGSDNKNFIPSNISEIKANAKFGLTWDGFFLKSSYTNGYTSISSDNDFQVIQTINSVDVERIKIGALTFSGTTPTKYGIRISDKTGAVVMESGDDGQLWLQKLLTVGPNCTGYSPHAKLGVIESYNSSGTVVTDLSKATYSKIFSVGSVENVAIYDNGLFIAKNAQIEGSITATSGYITGTLYVGSSTGSGAIQSLNYNVSAGTGWKIDNNSAIFNNVSVRGSIKTSVFEYSEIQAVGGAVLIRPSSSIKFINSYASTDTRLYLMVEHPELFSTNDWVKVSNFNINVAGAPSTEITKYGLVYVYKVTVQSGSGYNIILEDCNRLISDGVANKLIGGALINYGNENDTNNFGIGLNCSDNYIGLPQKAITLFDTNITPRSTKYYVENIIYSSFDLQNNTTIVESTFIQATQSQNTYTFIYNGSAWELNGTAITLSTYGITIGSGHILAANDTITIIEEYYSPVSYNIKSVLGTLPKDLFSEESLYETFLSDTEGLFTDNAYLGDEEQYLSFYTNYFIKKVTLNSGSTELITVNEHDLVNKYREKNTYIFIYNGVNWTKNGAVVSLDDYFIFLNSSYAPVENDNITIEVDSNKKLKVVANELYLKPVESEHIDNIQDIVNSFWFDVAGAHVASQKINYNDGFSEWLNSDIGDYLPNILLTDSNMYIRNKLNPFIEFSPNGIHLHSAVSYNDKSIVYNYSTDIESLNEAAFLTKVNNVIGNYTFECTKLTDNVPTWSLNGAVVDIATYGITLSSSFLENLELGNTFSIGVIKDNPTVASLSQEGFVMTDGVLALGKTSSSDITNKGVYITSSDGTFCMGGSDYIMYDGNNLKIKASTIYIGDASLNTLANTVNNINEKIKMISINSSEPSISIINSQSVLKLSSTKLTFTYDNNEIASFSQDSLDVKLAYVTNLHMRTKVVSNGVTSSVGNLRWIARTNGHLSLKVID